LTSQQKSTTDRYEVIVELYGASVPGAAVSKGMDRTTFTVFQISAYLSHPVIIKWPEKTVHTSCAAWGDLIPSQLLFCSTFFLPI